MTNPVSALVSISRHECGRPTAEEKSGTGRRGMVLAIYLMSDVQGNPYAVSEMLDWIPKVENNKINEKENFGNSFNLIMKPDGAIIENLIIEEELPEEYTLEEIRAALKDWGAVLDEIRKEKST